jgi:hypothetical protein
MVYLKWSRASDIVVQDCILKLLTHPIDTHTTWWHTIWWHKNWALGHTTQAQVTMVWLGLLEIKQILNQDCILKLLTHLIGTQTTWWHTTWWQKTWALIHITRADVTMVRIGLLEMEQSLWHSVARSFLETSNKQNGHTHNLMANNFSLDSNNPIVTKKPDCTQLDCKQLENWFTQFEQGWRSFGLHYLQWRRASGTVVQDCAL